MDLIYFNKTSAKFISYLISVHAMSLQSCLTLCYSMDCSPPGSSVHGILQEKILQEKNVNTCPPLGDLLDSRL